MLSHRQRRVEELIHTTLAEIIQQQVKDPRIPMIFTITHVKMTKDLQEARVYFSQIPDDPEAIEGTLDALDHANGFLRSQVGHAISLRSTPRLVFFYDESQKKAHRIEELLASVDIPPADDEEENPET